MAKKENEGFTKLKKDLSSGEIGNLYFFYGPESYLKERYLAEIRKRLVDGELMELNYVKLTGKDVAAPEIVEAAEACPVFSDRRLVVVTDYDGVNPPAADQDALTALYQDLPPYVCLIFDYDTLEYKANKKNKATAVALAAGTAVEFQQCGGEELIRWIARHFEALGKKIDRADCDYLTVYSGTSMTALSGEIEKIAAHASSDRVTRRDIEAVAVKSLDAAIYEMTDELSAGRPEKALFKMRELFRMGYDPIVLSASLTRQVMRLYSAKLCLKEGKGTAFLMELWGMRSSYPAEKLLKAADRFSLPALRQSMALCGEGDMALKRDPGDRQRMIELTLLKTAAALKGASA